MIDKVRIENAIAELILAIGDDPNRSGLKETPARIARMCEELFSGSQSDSESIINYFDENFGAEMIALKAIPFYSICEHHLLPFFGKVNIAYIPGEGKLLGISKLARVVDMFSKRLQLQERFTHEIANFLELKANAIGVAVTVEARHLCMEMRGVKKTETKTVTFAFRGTISQDIELRKSALKML